ncbi:MAG: tyrosine--tRNA ligase [Oscillospiraceae bacterium]|nr:tyrosine--tRNA ligase [Oscillospiraceae bacterium]
MMELYAELERRNIIAQVTNKNAVQELINRGDTVFYIGFDATADSLHVGHFIQFMMIRWLQSTGNKPIILLGTGTTLIGDPTGKTDMRKMLSKDEINHNSDCFQTQIEKYIDKNNAIFVRNGDWLCELKYLELLREVGTHFSVNRMLTAECVKTRMERGLSFLEFNYVVMQSYDFLHLHRQYNCKLQLGGDDQWSNILGGVELVRRTTQQEVFGMTFTLLTTVSGQKMGKTEKGALWLSEDRLPVYDFYQYWRNVDDSKVFEYMKALTFLPIEEIEEMERSHKDINICKKLLAFEITKLVHGETKAKTAQETATAIFSGNMKTKNMPNLTLTPNDFAADNTIALNTILIKLGLAQSKSEARRLIEQGAIKIDSEQISNLEHALTKKELLENNIVIQKGKKTFFKLNSEK